MIHVLRTAKFDQWLAGLKDRVGQKSIAARLDRLAQGHWGDCKAIREDITELRVHTGPGYRVYCWREGTAVVVALGGGNKSSQTSDIAAARAMVANLKE